MNDVKRRFTADVILGQLKVIIPVWIYAFLAIWLERSFEVKVGEYSYAYDPLGVLGLEPNFATRSLVGCIEVFIKLRYVMIFAVVALLIYKYIIAGLFTSKSVKNYSLPINKTYVFFTMSISTLVLASFSFAIIEYYPYNDLMDEIVYSIYLAIMLFGIAIALLLDVVIFTSHSKNRKLLTLIAVLAEGALWGLYFLVANAISVYCYDNYISGKSVEEMESILNITDMVSIACFLISIVVAILLIRKFVKKS